MTASLSAPSAGAVPKGRRAEGGTGTNSVGIGKRRTGERGGDTGHGDVEQPATAVSECLEGSGGRGQTGEGVGDGIATEHGLVV